MRLLRLALNPARTMNTEDDIFWKKVDDAIEQLKLQEFEKQEGLSDDI